MMALFAGHHPLPTSPVEGEVLLHSYHQVIPAQAGTPVFLTSPTEVPACAGMTLWVGSIRDASNEH
jgi:hypothetical protein